MLNIIAFFLPYLSPMYPIYKDIGIDNIELIIVEKFAMLIASSGFIIVKKS
jgi:hypothetical protein